jgi:hypothetical protein
LLATSEEQLKGRDHECCSRNADLGKLADVEIRSALGKVLHGNWKTVTFIAAFRHDRVTAPFVLEGAINGETFKA